VNMVEWLTQFQRRSDVTMDQHQARRGCGCTEQGKMLHNDVEQAWLVVLAHLWNLNLPY